MFIFKRQAKKQDGQVLITLVIVVPALILIVAAYMSLSVSNYQLARRDQFRTMAQMTADAGADYAIEQINLDGNWPGTAGETTLQTDSTKKTTYEVTVADNSSTNKTLTVVGRTYIPAGSASASSTVTLKIDLDAVTSGTGPTSVSTGVGGLILNNNAKISGGDVVVNGKITLSNGAQIGLSTNSVNVRSAHQSCPASAPYDTYPQVCGPGNGEPITLGTNARIYANVQAKNQTTGTNMFNPGLVACSGTNCDPVSLPTYDRTSQKAAITSTYASTDSNIACGNNESKTWPANVKITGNITTGNNCTVTISGDTWITGSVTMGNGAKFVVSNSLGTTMPTMMLDGGNTSGTGGFIFGNNSQIVPNSSSTGMQVVSFWSNSSCSPDCATLTGTELHDSQNITTINLSNNGSAPNSILWSHWTKVQVSNNGAIGAVAGQTVELGANAIINFTSSVPGSDNLVTTWVKRGYMRIY
ncbi:MAG TPA: hypothetical protein VFW52_00895 [Candidatus Saccharimonadales bacterium]|nr:hypothetical protein [Candidatus Saccharimonadales bacterium]